MLQKHTVNTRAIALRVIRQLEDDSVKLSSSAIRGDMTERANELVKAILAR